MTLPHRILLSLALAATPPLTMAQDIAIPVTNYSFEALAAPQGGFPVGVPEGWTLFDPGGIVNQSANATGVLNPTGTTFFSTPVPHGNNAALIYLEQVAGTTLAGDPVGLAQTLSTPLQADMRYTLTVGVGNIASGTGLGAFAPFGFTDLSGFPGYRVELLAGGEVIAFDENLQSIGEGLFGTSTVQISVGPGHAAIGQPLGIRLINLNASGNLAERGREVDFDNVQLVAAPVPEPATYAMWLGGFSLLTLLGARRRRRHIPQH